MHPSSPNFFWFKERKQVAGAVSKRPLLKPTQLIYWLANNLWRHCTFDRRTGQDETGDVKEYDDASAAAFECTANYAESIKLWDAEYVNSRG